MTESTQTPVEDTPEIAGSIPSTGEEGPSATKEKDRNTRKPKCPFLIEAWIPDKGEAGDAGEGFWMLILDEEAKDFGSTAKAETWALANLDGGDYRVMQERSAFTIATTEVRKSTFHRKS